MKSHYRVVVIGGGAVGVSTLYHLAKKGWSDVVLARAHRTHRRVHLARRRPAAAVQHELHGRPAAQVLGRPVQAPAGRDRARTSASTSPATCVSPRTATHGRVPEVLRHGQHHRRAVSVIIARRGQVKSAVAAGRAGWRWRHAAHRRRSVPPGRRPHRAGRPDDGAAQGRAQCAAPRSTSRPK